MLSRLSRFIRRHRPRVRIRLAVAGISLKGV